MTPDGSPIVGWNRRRAGAGACDRHVRPGPDAGHRCRRDRRPPGHPVRPRTTMPSS
ncbi:MAG: hypothetical protein MZV70_08845 [Desulfobacterales bacterium]|nr:hypothetical protein [Desulfobacterales bacterium]